MKRCHSSRWVLALTVAACANVAGAGPEECLTLRDNAAVASCANKFGPGTLPIVAPLPRPRDKAEHQPTAAEERWLLFPVPTRTSQQVVRVSTVPAVEDRVDRSELISRSEMGAAGLAAIGLVFGLWKWRTPAGRRCSFCDTRAVAGSSVCKRCFRSL